RHIRRRRYPGVIEYHRRAANVNARAGFTMAERILDCWIHSRRVDGKSQTHNGAPSPAPYDRLAILSGRGVVREGCTRELPHQCDVRRHRVGLAGNHGAQNRRTDTVTLPNHSGELCAWTAVLVAHSRNAGGEPSLDGEVTPELFEGGDARKQARVPRTRVDDVA